MRDLKDHNQKRTRAQKLGFLDGVIMNNRRQQMRQIFEKIISIPSVSDNLAANDEVISYIESFLKKRSMFISRHNYNGYSSLIATTKNTRAPKIMLVAHVDVVPADPEHFKLTESDGRFYGRGTLDMKFAIPAYLQLVDDLRDDLQSYDFGIMIVSDEEIGGYNGAKMLLNDGFSAEVAIIPDGGSNWNIESSAKGLFWPTITTYGKTAHGSRPWEGESAIDKMLDITAKIKGLFSETSPAGNTINIGQINAGNATNQVADLAVVKIDVRTVSPEDHAVLKQKIKAIAKEYQADVIIAPDEPPCLNDPEHPLIAPFVNAVRDVTKQKCEETASLAASDARFFSEKNIPCIVIYPTGGNIHGPKEWIDVEAFYQFYDVLAQYVNTVGVISKSPELMAVQV